MGLKMMDGNEAFYFLHEKGVLKGAVIAHIDNFNLAGTEEFINNILEVVDQQLTVSKVKKNKFIFTGLDITTVENGIEIEMDNYMNSLKDIYETGKVDRYEDLTKPELKEYRKMTER